MIDFITYENYFENLSDKHVSIDAFFPIDLEDMENAINQIRESDANIIVVLEAYAVGKHAQSSDQIFDRPHGAYLILQKLTNIRGDKTQERKQILSNTENICNSFEARIKRDKESHCTFLDELDFPSLNREKIGPILDSYYGWRTTFRFLSYNRYQVLAADWSDL